MSSPDTRMIVPILLYHSVSDSPPAGHQRFAVSPDTFRAHMRAVASSGRMPMTIRDLAAVLRGERQAARPPVLVTFDDGFADVAPAVEQVLLDGLAATVFITTGALGTSGMLTSREVEALARLGDRVELGAHSVTHPRLDELDRHSVESEVSDSKAALEDLVGARVRSFAYPHGAYHRGVQAAVRDAGFTAAAAVKNALSHSDDDRFALARVTITAHTDIHHLERLLHGSGARLAWRRERLRTRGYRAVRRLRRSQGTTT